MSKEKKESPYRMTLDLNALNHLGLHLYSNVPAVISEAVANAWDADVKKVEIEIDDSSRTICITDTGLGMSHGDLNDKYLKVGYARRERGENVSPSGRAVMG